MQKNTNEITSESQFGAIRSRGQAEQGVSVSQRIQSFQVQRVSGAQDARDNQTRPLVADLGIIQQGLVSQRAKSFGNVIRTDIEMENIKSLSQIKFLPSCNDESKLATIRINIKKLKDKKIKIDDYITSIGNLKFADESKKIEAIKIFFENENSDFFGDYDREKAREILGNDIEKNINDIVTLKGLNSLDEFTTKLVTLCSEKNPFIEKWSQTNPNLIYSFIEEKYVGKDVYESLKKFKLTINKIATFYNYYYFQTEAERELNAIMSGEQAGYIFDKLDKLVESQKIRFLFSQQESREALGLGGGVRGRVLRVKPLSLMQVLLG